MEEKRLCNWNRILKNSRNRTVETELVTKLRQCSTQEKSEHVLENQDVVSSVSSFMLDPLASLFLVIMSSNWRSVALLLLRPPVWLSLKFSSSPDLKTSSVCRNISFSADFFLRLLRSFSFSCSSAFTFSASSLVWFSFRSRNLRWASRFCCRRL